MLAKHDLAALQHGGTVQRSLTCGMLRPACVAADNAHAEIGCLASQAMQLFFIAIEKTRFFNQIARRIARERKLRKYDHFGAGLARLP